MKLTKGISQKKIKIMNDDQYGSLDDLPSEIDFSKLKQVENPIKKTVSVNLDSDLAIHFKNSKELNKFLRLQLKSLELIR